MSNNKKDNSGCIKIPSQKEAVKAFLVSNNGEPDIEASVEKFRNFLTKDAAKFKADQELIAKAVSFVYDFHRGVFLNMQFIQRQAIIYMGREHPEMNSPSLSSILSSRVQDYMQENTGDGKLFLMKKGTGGGFARISDLPKKEEIIPPTEKAT